MKLFARNWISTLRENGFGMLLRLTILLLPWQTRFFIEGPKMGGFVWEQGRWSLYATMILMGVIISISICRILPRLSFLRKQEPIRSEGFVGSAQEMDPRLRKDDRRGWVPAFVGMTEGAVALLLLLLPTLSLIATLQGFVQILLLLAFGWSVYSDEKLRLRLPFWIVLSLFPVGLFALGQSLVQFVPAIKWLGVALQDPAVRGVSVIEIGAERFLRAYGSFPHPNILGGWMMMGALISLREYLQREVKRYGWLAMSALCILTLYASFSRSAWIGCAVGLAVLGWGAWKKGKGRAFFLAVMGLSMIVGVAVAIKPELIITRVASKQRLEVKSVNERTASIKQGFEVIRRYPFGTGFGAYRVGLDRVCAVSSCVAPSESPHFVPLLALAELGWARVMGLMLVAGWMMQRNRFWKSMELFILLPLLVLACFDHYQWSLWAGQALLFECELLGIPLTKTEKCETIRRLVV